MSKPLEGMRILDFTQFMSGPMCTLLLSDFGAEVIKIENPPLGDNTRYGKIIEDEVSSHYAARRASSST
jgi:crotonobetainyl-CoA:carnitine CoA-transferase CaiB-like acyl-CoA transferase